MSKSKVSKYVQINKIRFLYRTYFIVGLNMSDSILLSASLFGMNFDPGCQNKYTAINLS